MSPSTCIPDAVTVPFAFTLKFVELISRIPLVLSFTAPASSPNAAVSDCTEKLTLVSPAESFA